MPSYDLELSAILGASTDLAQQPSSVTAVPRLQWDLEALRSLFSVPHPPTRFVCATHIQVALYGFGDASGSGFGSSIALPDGCLLFRHGIWNDADTSSSSNFRELNNLVTAIEEGIAAGHLQNTELFLFTDNSTAEGAFYKGNSPCRALFELVLRLRTIEMQGQLKLYIIHIAGSRMIARGTDGLSRGDFTAGVMSGSPMLHFVPLHLCAHDRSSSILPWIQTWTRMPFLLPLTPEQWYTTGHGLDGNIVGCLSFLLKRFFCGCPRLPLLTPPSMNSPCPATNAITCVMSSFAHASVHIYGGRSCSRQQIWSWSYPLGLVKCMNH